MHLLVVLLLLTLLAPGRAAAEMPVVGGAPLEGLAASSWLDTSWPYGYGPRLPAPFASQKALRPPLEPHVYGPALALDGDPRTAWVPEDSGLEAWIRMDLAAPRFVEELRIVGGGSLAGEPPEENSFLRALTVVDPVSEAMLPPRSLSLEQTPRPQAVSLYGHIYQSLSITVDQIFPGPSERLPVAEIEARVLPLDPAAVAKALELPEGASMAAIRDPTSPGGHLLAWSGLDKGRLHAELVGLSGGGDGVRARWREPVSLQWRGAEAVDLRMEPVSFGGPPSLLLTYHFEDSGVSLAFARVYVLSGGGAFPAWETSLIGDLTGQRTQSLRFSGGKAFISERDEDLGYAMTQKVFRYDGSFRQFEPAPNQQPGVTTSVIAPTGSISGLAALYDGEASTPVLVPGDGVGTMIQLHFSQPRRISAVRLLPGTTAADADGSSPGYTRPSTLRLMWPGGHTLDAELEDAAEMQTIFEGWDGPDSAPTEGLTLTVTGVYPAVPGGKMAISGLEVYFLDPP